MKNKFWEKIIILSIGAAFVLSFALWFLAPHRRRYVMKFQSTDHDGLCLEERYVPVSAGDSMLQFVDELLLGPETAHYRHLFSPGTRTIYCFVRNKVLFVNLSDEVLLQTGDSSSIRDGTEIFKENILSNFRNIKGIEMFVGGKYVSWAE
ncbi:MAG: GerMN domain-containing protein [Treponema sp.]|jgi:hypothetical protein|nr:GerMN domain-containing protein [Treponema sp.]